MMKANYGMSKKNGFRDYLVRRDKKSYGHLLMEGLTDIKQMIFPNVGIADAVRFLRLVPGWTDSTLDSEMTLEFMSEQAAQDFKNKLDNKLLQKPLREKFVSGLKLERAKKVGGSSAEFKIPAPDGMADGIKERFFEQMFSAAKTFFGRNGLGNAISTLGYKDGSVTITTDDAEMREKAWMALSAVMSNSEISDNTLKAITAGNELKAKDQKAAKAAMKPFVAAIQKAMGSIKPANASEKEKAEIKAATKSGSAGVSVKYVGNYNACSIVYMLYSDPNSHIAKSWDTPALSSLIEVSLTLNNLLRSGLLIERPDFKAAEIEAAVTITGSVSQRQRILLQMLDAECAPRTQGWKDGIQKQIDAINTKLKAGEGSAEDLTRQMDALKAQLSRKQMTPREVITKMMAENAGLKMVNYLKLRADDIKAVRTAILTKAEEERPKDLKGKDKEEWAKKLNAELTAAERSVNHMDLDQFGSLDEMLARVTNDTRQLFTGTAGETAEEKQKKFAAVRDYVPEFSNPVAKRRWKLFEAFKHTDNGEVYSNKDWTVSICKTDRQLGIFARNKPKVGNDGSIIAAANLEDWEGITSDNRRIRDGGGAWVKDKLRKQYDEYETESVWCVAGSYTNHGHEADYQTPIPWGHTRAHVNGGSNYSDYRVTDARHGKILLQFMDNNTGMLFMLGTLYILDEGDGSDGEICGRDGIETLRRHCARLPSLNQLITDCGLYKSLIEFNGLAKSKSEQEILQEAIDNGVVTPDGEMNIVSASQLAIYKSVVPKVSKINIRFSNASGLFKSVFNGQNIILPVVNCRDVTNADLMFYGVHSPTIDLENTDGITSMVQMFSNAWTSEITGLDTSAAKTMDSAFYNCRQKVFQMISIPALDLRSCTSISNAFAHSFISSVTMMNTDKIRKATNAFLDMPFLQKVPDIRFKNIIEPNMLRQDENGRFNGDFTTIFDGCDALLGRSEFDKKIQEIEQYYMHPSKDRKSDFLDDRNFIIIHSADDVRTYAKHMYKYDGVVIAEDASCYNLFYGIPNLKIRVLDVNGHEDLHFMLRGCTNFAIGKIIGTENVKTADSMFYNSKCNVCPRLNFPNLTGQITVFRGMFPFGNNSSPGLLKTGQYVEDFDLSGNDQERISEIARKLFYETATQWMQNTVIMNVVGSLYDNNIATRTKLIKEKYVIDDSGFITVNENDIKQNLKQILELKPKGLRLSKEFVEQLEQDPYSYDNIYDNPSQNPLWQKTRSSNLSLPDIDLNGLKHGDMLFAGAQFAQSGKIIGIDKLETARFMFYMANLPGVTNLGKLTFSKLTDATSMFRRINVPVSFEDLSFPAVKVADKMFFGTPFVNAALDKVSFPQAIHAHHMFEVAAVTEIGELDMPKLQNAASMFQNCVQLKLVGDIDLPAVINCDYMFSGCSNLTNVSRFFVPNSTMCSFTFAQCAKLKVIHAFKVNADSTESMFYQSALSVVYGKDGKALVARSKLLND